MFRKYSIISLKFLCAPVVWNAGHISFTKTTVSGYRFPKQALQSVLLKSYGKYKLWKALVIVLGLMCNSFHGEDIVGVLEWNGETSHWITQACESPMRQAYFICWSGDKHLSNQWWKLQRHRAEPFLDNIFFSIFGSCVSHLNHL